MHSLFDVARGVLRSGMATNTREDSSSLLLVFALVVAALLGAVVYLSLLAVGRARR